MRPHVSGTECVGFSKQDTRGNLVVVSLQASFSPFQTLRKASAVNVRWTEHDSYLSFSHKILELTLSEELILPWGTMWGKHIIQIFNNR